MNIEVSILNEETHFEVQVWNTDEGERAEDLERSFDTQTEVDDYVDDLVQNKQYIVQHV